MTKLTNLISLPLINIYDLKVEGIIESVLIDFKTKKAKYVLVYNEDNDTYMVVSFSDIFKIGENAVLIANNSKITLYENMELSLKNLVNPLNSMCYNLDGVLLGKITEINLENNNLHSIEIGNLCFQISHIIGLNENLAIICDKKTTLSRFKCKNKFSFVGDNNIKVSVSSTNTPTREIANYNFLLKRKVLKNIIGENGEVLLKSGSQITPATINKLKYYGRLKELTLNSK